MVVVVQRSNAQYRADVDTASLDLWEDRIVGSGGDRIFPSEECVEPARIVDVVTERVVDEVGLDPFGSPYRSGW